MKRTDLIAAFLAIVILVPFIGYFMTEVDAQNVVPQNIVYVVDTTQLVIENVTEEWNIQHPTQIKFNFGLNEEPSLITYSLDNQANITVTGNFTLTNLPAGKHNLTLYVTDQAGNKAHQTYTVKLPDQTVFYGPAFYVAPIFAVTAVCLALLLYFRNDHRKKVS